MTSPAASILIVDDEPQNCRLLERLLKPEGYLTRIASNGAEALASIAQDAPDLVLLDIMMPGTDGYKVASTLKANPATSNIPIIIVTQRMDRAAHLAGLDAGAEEFLMKPVNRVELLLRVRNLLRLKSLGDFSRNHGTVLEQQVQARTAELQRFRAAMQISGDGIVLVDRASMRYIDVNQTMCDMVGHTRDDLLRMTPMDLFGAERTVLERDYDAVIADRNSSATLVEGQYRHKDGSLIPVETRRRALHTGDGWIVVGTVRDITARKKAEQELQESDSRFRSLTMLSSDWFWEQDEDYRFVKFSGGAGVAGWGPDQAIAVGLHRWDLGGVIPISSSWDEHKALLDARKPYRKFEYRRILGDGRLQYVEASGEPIFTASGLFTGYRGVATDITARKAAEARIKRLNRVYAVLSGINTLIVRASDREALFREACQIAVEHGRFSSAWIGIIDRSAQRIIPVAAAGEEPDFLTLVREEFSLREDSPMGNTKTARAVREKKAVVSNDIRGDPAVMFARQRIARGIASMAILPLVVAGEVEGVLALYADEAGFFDDEEMTLLTELAGDIAFALAHISEAVKLARMTRVNAMLSDINAAIVRIRGRQDLFEETCLIAVEAGSLPFAWIGVADESGTHLKLVASAGRDDGFLQTIRDRLAVRDEAPEAQSLSTRAIRERRVVVVNDVGADAVLGRRKAFADRGIKSVAVFPLFIAGRVAGALVLHSEQAGFFDDAELKLLNQVAANIAFALEHIEKEDKVLRLTRVYAMLSRINSAIVRIRERDALFRETCQIAVADGGFFLARVVEVDPDGKARIAATTESDTRLFQKIVEEYNGDPANSGSLLAVALRSEQPIISNDVANDPRIPNREALTREGNYALALLPIIVKRRIVGIIILRSRESGMFDEDELQLLRGLISNLSFALEHIEEEAKVRRLTRVYAVLSGINSLIVRVRDRDELFKEACRIAVEHGGFRLAWIGLIDRADMKLVPVASAGSTEDLRALFKQTFSLGEDEPPGNSYSAEAIREKKASVSNDVQNDARVVFKDQHAKRGSRSMAILPLQISGEVIGLLALYSEEVGFFDEEELKLLTELAGDIAFAVDHIDKRDRLDYLAYYDELTGLANRGLFLERTAQYMRSAASGGHKLALFFVDLERFRNINDSLGRPVGDALLKQVSAWLSRAVGDPSLLARLGADHFAVVLPEVRQGGNVTSLLEKRIREFLDHSFQLNDSEFRIAAKVGIALFPDDGADADSLLRNAEVALKKAKARGERFLYYKSKMTDKVAGKLSLETQLRRALDMEEFVLHYQPKVNLGTGKLTGAEALIRWNDPRTGLVPPGRFIPVLEETGLILEVGRWALRKALEEYLRWRAAGLPAVRIAVNVSPLQLRNPGFIAEIAQATAIHADAAAGLELEITESLIMEDVKHNIASLQAIRAMGVPIAIDDFGTGFSSLSYLSRLPVDTLKIDRSFVVDMITGPPGLALVPTIINLAHSLKLEVVAEGVETEEQSRLLRLLGCDEMQGFLFSKPVPSEIFAARFLALPPVVVAA